MTEPFDREPEILGVTVEGAFARLDDRVGRAQTFELTDDVANELNDAEVMVESCAVLTSAFLKWMPDRRTYSMLLRGAKAEARWGDSRATSTR